MRTLPVLLACLTLATAADAQDQVERRTVLRTDGAGACAVCLDDYLIVPEYMARCDSSRGVEKEEFLKKYAVEYLWHYGGKTEKRSTPPDLAELRAADALPSLSPGDYGWLHSVEVVSIEGKNDMLVKNLWLVDPDWAAKDLKDFTEDVTDKLDKGKAAIEKNCADRIAAVEKDKVRFQTWVRFRGRASPRDQAPILNEYARKISELTAQKNNALRDLELNKVELLKMAKRRGRAHAEALRIQNSLDRDLAQVCLLTGFSTAGLKPGSRFAGPDRNGLQVAVAWREKSGRRVLAALALLKKPLNQADLQALIDKRHVRSDTFNQEIMSAKQGKLGVPATHAARQAMRRWIWNPGAKNGD